MGLSSVSISSMSIASTAARSLAVNRCTDRLASPAHHKAGLSLESSSDHAYIRLGVAVVAHEGTRTAARPTTSHRWDVPAELSTPCASIGQLASLIHILGAGREATTRHWCRGRSLQSLCIWRWVHTLAVWNILSPMRSAASMTVSSKHGNAGRQ